MNYLLIRLIRAGDMRWSLIAFMLVMAAIFAGIAWWLQ